MENLPYYLNSRSLNFFPVENVAAVKIDVEGAEMQALAGASRFIERYRPVILVESLTQAAADALEGFFGGIDYTGSHLSGERNMIFLPRETSKEIITRFDEWSCTAIDAKNLIRAREVFCYPV
jgi:hypothetical protein